MVKNFRMKRCGKSRKAFRRNSYAKFYRRNSCRNYRRIDSVPDVFYYRFKALNPSLIGVIMQHFIPRPFTVREIVGVYVFVLVMFEMTYVVLIKQIH